MITRIAWQHIPRSVTRTAATLALAASLGVAAQVRSAEAGSRWVGPAIAGLVVGGILAHEYHRHHTRHHRYYYAKPVKRRIRHHRPAYYPPYAYYAPFPPAVVVPIPIPVPLFVVPGRW